MARFETNEQVMEAFGQVSTRINSRRELQQAYPHVFYALVHRGLIGQAFPSKRQSSTTDKIEQQVSKMCPNNDRNRQIIEEYKRHMLRMGRKPASVLNKLISVSRLLKIGKNFDELTRQDLEKLWDSILTENLQGTTKNNIGIQLKYFVKWVDEWLKGDSADFSRHFSKRDYPSTISWLNLQRTRPKLRELFEDKDILSVLPFCTHRDSALLMTCFETGARINEVLSLKIEDIKVKESCIEIRILDSKTLDGRRTIYCALAKPFIMKWLGMHPCNKPESILFCSRTKTKLGYNAVSHTIGKCFSFAGLKFKGFHVLRHMRATADGKMYSGAALARKFGWTETSSMPSHYQHLNNKDMELLCLKSAGVVVKENPSDALLKLKKCPVCKEEILAHLEVCSVCGNSITEHKVMQEQLQKTSAQLQSLTQEMFFLKRGIKSLQELPEGLVATEKINGKYIVATKEQDSVAEAEYQE